MNFIKQIERLELLNKLISMGKTGTPDELADRLEISKRQLYRMIELFKDWNAPIKYNKQLETFYYEESFLLEINFSLKVLTPNETQKIYGGGLRKRGQCHFMSRNQNILSLRKTG